jgi:hypothetical protein
METIYSKKVSSVFFYALEWYLLTDKNLTHRGNKAKDNIIFVYSFI